MINLHNIDTNILEPAFMTVYACSQGLTLTLDNMERDKWAFERLIMDTRYESWFKRRAVRRSLHHTTRIEGNTLREEQVGDVLAGEKLQVDAREVAEIVNCNRALEFVDSISENNVIPIDEHVIRHLDALILGDDDPTLTPGEYRKGENWVRHYMSNKRVYTPPNQGDVPSLMREFSLWLRAEHKDINPVLVAGISHLRLVAIHPFWDGNGRTARALTTLILQREGYGFNKLLSLERYFSLDMPNYFNAINSTLGDCFVRQCDFTKWLEYFAGAVHAEVKLVSDEILDFKHSLEKWYQLFGEKGVISSRQIDALAYALLHNGIRPRDYMKQMKVSHETARRELKALADLGLLKAAGRGRARKYLPIELDAENR